MMSSCAVKWSCCAWSVKFWGILPIDLINKKSWQEENFERSGIFTIIQYHSGSGNVLKRRLYGALFPSHPHGRRILEGCQREEIIVSFHDSCGNSSALTGISRRRLDENADRDRPVPDICKLVRYGEETLMPLWSDLFLCQKLMYVDHAKRGLFDQPIFYKECGHSGKGI